MKKFLLKNMLILILMISSIVVAYADTSEKILNKSAIFVVGPGRCGSSCLMGVLQILGIPIGDNFSEPYEGNAKGEFEHHDFREINYYITEQLAGTKIIFHLPLIDWATHSKRESYKNLIKKQIEQTFGNSSLFAFKCPRISFFLPLYIQAAQELGYTPKIIIMFREPEEIVRSFLKGYIQPSPINFEIISCYVTRSYMSTFQSVKNHNYIILSFSELLHNTESSINQLNEFINETKTFNQVIYELEGFLDKNLKHFNVDSGSLKSQRCSSNKILGAIMES